MVKLYEKTLQALKPENVGDTLRDDLGGLWGKVNMTARGITVAFSYRYRCGSKTRDFGCGTWPDTSLADVRAARNTAADLVRKGRDPIDERAAKRAADKAELAKAKPITIKELFKQWKDSELATRKDGGAEPERAFKKDVFPLLGNKPAASVTKGLYLVQLDSIKSRAPSLANKILSYLYGMYAWGVNRELVPTNPLEGLTRGDVGGADNERERVLVAGELQTLHTLLDAAALPDAVRHALMVIIGTGARSNEVIRAKKAHVVDRLWTIPPENSKNGKAHTIWLSDWAKFHMDALMALSGGSAWLMPDSSDPMTHAHGKVLVNATSDRQLSFYSRKIEGRSLNYGHTLEIGSEKWTPHDLRRSAATLMGELGIVGDVIDRALNHVERNKVRRIYQRQVLQSQQFEAWRVLGDKLMELMPLPLPVAS
ncbi:tyrosine-type recombinase/integrase [Paraburkholderia sp. DHOC27]|uniref:tyrosine-type recombinase/integrase n=1 Tax=Paraburkholderia sp. DHOC27 TaxID=2303330 RepID=UPI000E3EB10C|nr:tyrosine-type recombinase/integrase [Paraburkholderia sp. DHOC27]RFU48638.1 DUF4102 domain-containing protein [Paraburkholderia sp. DHOC27]